MDRIAQGLIAALKFQASGKLPEAPVYSGYSEADWKSLCNLAARHKVVHLVGDCLLRQDLPLPSEVRAYLERELEGLLRYGGRMELALLQIRKALSGAGIAYLPLKGAVIRRLYPAPWMRLGCDLDILVHEEDLQRAAELLAAQCGFALREKAFHDWELMSNQRIRLELHFSICEGEAAMDRLLEDPWRYARPSAEDPFCYEFSPDFFLFHFYAHSAYHFTRGGCGVRGLLDLYLMGKDPILGEADPTELLREGGLQAFSEQMLRLSECWFGEGAATAVTETMGAFVMSGGAYGTQSNGVGVDIIRQEGASRRLRKRLWLPYDSLINRYPVLKGRRWLQPVLELYRWLDILKPKKRRRIAAELKRGSTFGGAERELLTELLAELGLKK